MARPRPNLEVVTPAPARPSLPDDGAEDSEEASPLSALLGGANDAAAVPRRSWEPLSAVTGDPLRSRVQGSAAAGRLLELDHGASRHPLAAGGRSATFTAADGALVQVAWVDPALLQAHRSMPRLLRRERQGVGDEAYRAVIGGGVVARRGGDVLMVMGRIPGSSDRERNQAFEAIARAALRPSGGR